MMASWNDLPTEIHFLIVRSYIKLILSEIDDLQAGEWIDRKHHLVGSVCGQVLQFAVALPFLRRDIVSCCAEIGARYRREFGEAYERYMYGYRVKCALFVVEKLNHYWAHQSWRDFRWAMRAPARAREILLGEAIVRQSWYVRI